LRLPARASNVEPLPRPGRWVSLAALDAVALPAPLRRLLTTTA
ncbi:MAG: hypothetical protein RLZZ592_1141, partial [Pseudomonadota bacterium]